MFEKVNPGHPDKMADRLAGAIVDLAYAKSENPKIAVEVLGGHGKVYVIIETSEQLALSHINDAIIRIYGKDIEGEVKIIPQDAHLADNQADAIRCGDNGIFCGAPVTREQQLLTKIAASIYEAWPYDGKYIIDHLRYIVDGTKPTSKTDAWVRMSLTICQSHASESAINAFLSSLVPEQPIEGVKFTYNFKSTINPLGKWEGGPNVDSGATNRKLGSDMGDGVTGGGLHGKDLSKADVSVNIWAHLEAQRTGQKVEARCSIGDTEVNGIPYEEIVEVARDYIFNQCGGFEKFAEWGLIRP